MNNISSSAYNLYERVWLTNEIPPMDTYGILNSRLKNQWAKDFLGVSKVEYDSDSYESKKYIRGTQSANYKADYIEYIDTSGNTLAAYIEKPNFYVEGLWGTEIDYLLHEMHRYLFRLYPEHYNTLITLTENERYAYFQEAGYLINSSFDLENMKVEDNEEETFYRYHKFITNVTTARKYTGTLKQETTLLRLLGADDVVSNCDYYTADNGMGIITNVYTGKENLEVAKTYEFISENAVESEYEDSLFANTDDTFTFACGSVSSQNEVSIIKDELVSFRKTDDLFKDIQSVINTIYKYGSEEELDYLSPVSTDKTIADILSEYSGVKISEDKEDVKFVCSFEDRSSIVPLIDGQFSMQNILDSQNKTFTNAFKLGDVKSSFAFSTGDVQYNESFLNWVSLFIRNKLQEAFDTSEFAVKYTGSLRDEDSATPIPWEMSVSVLQGMNPILKGVLSKEFIAECYRHAGNSYDIGTGEFYNPGNITPSYVFSHLVNPRNMGGFTFGGSDFTINLTITRFYDYPALDSEVLEPHFGIPYIYETEDCPAFSTAWFAYGSDTEDDVKDDYWPVRDSLSNGVNVVSIGEFGLCMNTVELPYSNMFKVYANFDSYANVVITSQEDETMKRIYFFNRVKLHDYDLNNLSFSQFTSDNVSEYIFHPFIIDETRLLKSEGYAIDESHIKIEKDITDLVKKYGRVDFLILNCKGDKFFGKIDGAYIESTYCICTINQMSNDFNMEDWKETKIYVYFWHKTNDLLEDSEAVKTDKESLDKNISVRPAQYESIPYFIANVKDLSSANYRYLYNNVFSEDASAFFTSSMLNQGVYIPSTLSKYESILSIAGADQNFLNVAKTLIDEHKSLYLDSSIYSNMVIPYVGKSVCYSGLSNALSASYNTNNLPVYAAYSTIDLGDYPDFSNFYEAAQSADEKDMGYIETTYNNHLVIWGDVVWDTNEKDTYKRLRTIWSSYLSSFVIEDLKNRFPTYSQIISSSGDTTSIIKIANFNYSYNDGLPTTSYNLTLPGLKDANITVKSSINILDDYKESLTTDEAQAMLYPYTSSVYQGISIAFPALLPTKKANGSVSGYSQDQVNLNNCDLQFGKYYKCYTDEELDIKISENLNVEVGNYNVKIINPYTDDYMYSGLTDYFHSSSHSLELLAQTALAEFVYNVYGQAAYNHIIPISDLLEYYLPENYGYVPCIFHISEDSNIVLTVMNIEKTKEAPEGFDVLNGYFYKIILRDFTLPAIPELFRKVLGHSANIYYKYSNTDITKTLQETLSAKGNHIPLGAEGVFNEIDLITEVGNNIFSDSTKSRTSDLYQNKKVINGTLTRYIADSTSFEIEDLLNGQVNEYSISLNTKSFKDYKEINFNILLDGELKEGDIYDKIKFQLPSGISFEDTDNIILHNIRTPLTRSLYSLNNEIKILDRRYNLPISNVIAYNSSAIYLKTNDIIITDVDGIKSSVIPTNENKDQPIPDGTSVVFGKHWKPSETGVGYRYYKRKFVATGTVYASTPNRIDFGDDFGVTLSDHISAGDDMQMIVVTPLKETTDAAYYSLTAIQSDKSSEDAETYTWKLLSGDISKDDENIVYNIYLSRSYGSTVQLCKVVLSTESNAKLSVLGTYPNSNDIIYKEGKYYVTSTDGVDFTSKEISLTSDQTAPGLSLESSVDSFESLIETTGDTDFNVVSLQTAPTGDPVISPVVACIKINDSTHIICDMYGRWIKEYKENGSVAYTLLNDPGFLTQQDVISSDMDIDTFTNILSTYIPLSNNRIADLEDTKSTYYVDPESQPAQLLGMYDLLGCASAVGKTIKEAIKESLLILPTEEKISLPVYTENIPFDVAKEVTKLSPGSFNINASNFTQFAKYFLSTDVDITRIKQISASTIDKDNKKVYAFDKSTCMVYVIDYENGGVAVIPLYRFLGLVHQPSWDTNNEYPLLTPTVVIPCREDSDKQTAWEAYRNLITSLTGDHLTKVAEKFNTLKNTAKDSYGNLLYEGYPDFNIEDFNTWVSKMEDLIYINAGEAWITYNSCPWKPSVLSELALDASNVFGIDWYSTLKDILPAPGNSANVTNISNDIFVDGTNYYKINLNKVVYKDSLIALKVVDKEGYVLDDAGSKILSEKSSSTSTSDYVINRVKKAAEAYNNMLYYYSLETIEETPSISTKLEEIGNDTSDSLAALKNYLIMLQLGGDEDLLMPPFANLTAGSLITPEGYEGVRICPLSEQSVFESKIASVGITIDSDAKQIVIQGSLYAPSEKDELGEYSFYDNYNRDEKGYYSFAVAIDTSSNDITQILSNGPKHTAFKNEDSMWIANTLSSTEILTGGGASNVAAGNATARSYLNIPASLIWDSGYFDKASIQSDGAIKFRSIVSSFDVDSVVEATTATIGYNFFTYSGNSLQFNNVDSATVVVMIQDYKKDNFQFGYGDVSIISQLPEMLSVFEVNESKYADFASQVNAYNIDSKEGGYYPIFENGDYPYITDIAQNELLPNFYECTFNSLTQKYEPVKLTNALGRRVLPMYPISIHLTENKYLPSGGITSVILNKGYEKPGQIFKYDDNKDGCWIFRKDEKSFTDIPSYTSSNGNSTDEVSVYSGLTQSSTIGKSYSDVEAGAGTLYKMVADPKNALISKCYATFTKEINKGLITVGGDYICITGINIAKDVKNDKVIDTYRNANNRLNTTPGTTMGNLITIESLSFKTTYDTEKLPLQLPITQFSRTTSSVNTTLDEIAIPLGGYGCTISQIGNGFFNPEYPEGITEEVVTNAISSGEGDPREINVGCRFKEAMFFKKGSLKNSNGDVFKIYLGQDDKGDPVYNETYFGSHKLTYSSFYQADKVLSTKIAPQWEIDSEYVLPDLVFTAGTNNTVNNNVIEFTYKNMEDIWGKRSYNSTTSYPEIIYQLAAYGKTWSADWIAASQEIDEDNDLCIDLEELIDTDNYSDLKTLNSVIDFVGLTRRFNGSISASIPSTLKHYDKESRKVLHTILFTGENSKYSASGAAPESSKIFACNEKGQLYRVLNDPYGTITEGEDEGDLINVAAISVQDTDIRKLTLGKNSAISYSLPGVSISATNTTAVLSSNQLVLKQDGSLSFFHISNKNSLSSGLDIKWVSTNGFEYGAEIGNYKNSVRCDVKASDTIEFTYKSSSGYTYNYITLFDKNMEVVGQIYLGTPITSESILSYVRA